jgi:mono/diheme cytochrome c family protein
MGHARSRLVAATVFAGILGAAGLAGAADGPALWEKHCASCHGPDGKGDTKAGKLTKVRDLTAADVRATLKRDHVRETIVQGIVDKETGKSRMKGYKDKLSAEEIDALTTHVLGITGAGQ